MNSLDKIVHSNTASSSVDEALPTRIYDTEIARLTELIRSQDIKIQALVQEVAYLRRIRYGVKSEAMSAEQRSLFEACLSGCHPNPLPVVC